MIYDYIVIGAGYGGLASASLLAQYGYKVCVLESHGKLGGCASFFKRDGVPFNAGATTISGFGENKPIYNLFKELGLLDKANSKLKKLDIGMIINIDGYELVRYSDNEKWKEEAKKFFDLDQKQLGFFDLSQKIDTFAWKLLDLNKKLMPSSLKDWLSMFSLHRLWANFKALTLVPGLFLSFEFLLKFFRLENNELFKRFANEQLIITTQNYMDKAPYLSSILGIAYPGEVYVAQPDISSLAYLLEEKIKESGSDLYYRQEVTGIDYAGETYTISTNPERAKRSQLEQTEWKAKNIISNTPIWNLSKIAPKEISNKLKPYIKKSPSAWGAFMVYLLLDLQMDLRTNYYQIHTDSLIPYCNSKSFFVSIVENDKLAITISTHCHPDDWFNLSEEHYESRKKEVQDFILEELFRKYPEFNKGEILHLSTGSPKSFEHYTLREKGYVGGIPHSIDNPIIKMCPNKLNDSFYLVGDTTFPGQGITAVIYSGISVSEKIKASSK